MLDDLYATLRPGQRVLDAGCGTGAVSRQIVALCPQLELTMLDLSPQMVARTADIPGRRILGSVLELPFPDDEFDLVVSAWVIETVPDPMRAVNEWASRAASAWLRAVVKSGYAGDFLDAEQMPWHGCDHAHRHQFRHGLTNRDRARQVLCG